ncbi:hypothetical protein [Mucilaginibacter jinjuensis]|uniref:AAA+ ATPase domain-containing protein n=1 Tax=Mucilaginibacter jinjuensis TaxID=1176721 RepID=A0ABY7T6T5_9SPHI|nr:hypothetical protein [Mucilaginibacter jinjuensis]WCT11556.1 hypothetical protein PQO05_22715 [Mucilaginibacter jinjuensis]
MKELDNYYNSYNARHLNPAEVARSFIYSGAFQKLITNDHAIILGARGCGKTTLMKMLTLPALNNWQHENATDIRQNLPFFAIYVSTDIYWDVKNQTYSSELSAFGNLSDRISLFSVTSNVFNSLCDTFCNILEFHLHTDDEAKEIELCRYLIKAWKLDSTAPKLEYVKEALNERVDMVNQFIQDIIFNHKEGEAIKTPDFFNLSFETSLEYVIPIFERIYSISGQRKWALCFDELEFAPLWLQEKLFKSLRSRTQYILYKLSASPILPLELEKSLKSEYSPTSGNDVTIIKMWGTGDTDEFSRKIIDACLEKNIGNIDSKAFFGSNEIYNKSSDSYEHGSKFYNEMLALLKKDESFAQFLEKKDVDIKTAEPTDSQKDVLFRKIKPVVSFRNYYLSENKRINGKYKTGYRGRKTGELYYGIEILTKICDGNPRWLIALITAIITKSPNYPVPEKVQYDEIINTSKRFKNVIANIPTGPSLKVPLTDIIDRLGSYFKQQVLGPTFNLDPKGTFIVDENEHDISDEVVKLLEKGISQGALILVENNAETFDFVIRGKRLKLAYLFFPLYDLPVRKYTALKMSECLRGLQLTESGQTSLF